MRHLDLADLVVLAAEVSEVEDPKLLELLDTPEMAAVLRLAGAPPELAAAVLVAIVSTSPLPTGNRRLALLAAVQLLAVNGLDATLDPEATSRLLGAVAAGDEDTASVGVWLGGRVTAHDPLDGALHDLLSPDAWRAIRLAVLRAYRHGRRLAGPADLLMGLFREGTGPAALALGADGRGMEVVTHPPRPYVPPRLPAFEPDVRRVLALAFCTSVALGHAEINGGHLLLGLLDAGHEDVLPEGLDEPDLRRLVVERLGPGAPDEDDLTERLGRLTARLRTTDPDAAAELAEVVDLQGIGLDRLVEMVRAWRGEIFLDAVARDDVVLRLLGPARLGAHASTALDDRLLAKYLADIERYPELTPAEEAEVAASLRTATDDAAAQLRRRLIESNLRLVVSMARKLGAPGLSMLDLVQEGNLGLLRAAERYDPTKGYRFSTFATWWVRDAITRAKGRRRP
jgi:hypothetical protein